MKKCVLALELGHTPDPALSELLSQGESLGVGHIISHLHHSLQNLLFYRKQESSLPADFRENANLLLSKVRS